MAKHRYNVWIKSLNDNENHFTVMVTPEEAKKLEDFLKARTGKDVGKSVVVRNQDMTFERVSAELKTWLKEA